MEELAKLQMEGREMAGLRKVQHKAWREIKMVFAPKSSPKRKL